MHRALVFLFVVASAVGAAERYRPAEILDWKPRSFKSGTDYALVSSEEANADHAAVRARCHNASASVRSGRERLGEWVTERRNVLEDFQRLHDLEPERMDALAIMTDCDNADNSATTWYGPIRWIKERPVQDTQGLLQNSYILSRGSSPSQASFWSADWGPQPTHTADY